MFVRGKKIRQQGGGPRGLGAFVTSLQEVSVTSLRAFISQNCVL